MFTEMPESKWGSLIPVAIHGDEGRGRLKNPVMVVSLQSLLPLHGKKTNMQGLLGFACLMECLFVFFCMSMCDARGP